MVIFDFESLTMPSSSYSQGVVYIRWRDHRVGRQVECPHQVMNVNKRVEFGHLFWLNDVAADSHYPGVKRLWLKA